MAVPPPPGLTEPSRTPQHFSAPTARELRSQAVYRLQVGLFGLCAMLLIVGLTNIIRDRLQLSDTEDPIQQVVSVDDKPKKAASDPLADIGVVPAAEPTPSPTPSARLVDPAPDAPASAMTDDPLAP